MVQAVFDLADAPHLLPALAELGIEPEDGLLILSREVAREGRNIARVNGRSYPVSTLRQVGDLLVDLHGQHEHQSLLREEHHLAFLDALGDEEFLRAVKLAVAELGTAARRLLAELQALHTRRARTPARAGFALLPSAGDRAGAVDPRRGRRAGYGAHAAGQCRKTARGRRQPPTVCSMKVTKGVRCSMRWERRRAACRRYAL